MIPIPSTDPPIDPSLPTDNEVCPENGVGNNVGNDCERIQKKFVLHGYKCV